MLDDVLCRLESPLLLVASPYRIIHARRTAPCHQNRDLSAQLGQLERAGNCCDDRSSRRTGRTETSDRRKGRVAPSFVCRDQRFFTSRGPCDCCRVFVFGLLIDGEGHGPDEGHTRERCKGAYTKHMKSVGSIYNSMYSGSDWKHRRSIFGCCEIILPRSKLLPHSQARRNSGSTC